jgi:glutaminyl-peptide cyclotransferase
MSRLRAYGVELILTGTLLLAVLFFGYLGYGLLRTEVINEPFSGDKALANATKLTAFGPRATGTKANVETGNWMVEQLRLLGWDVVIQPFTVDEGVAGRNIIAVRSHSVPGSPVVMLTTPYDTRLVADADPDPANQKLPAPGANASASGAATLLELARTLDVEATGHTVCLGFFDAEQNEGLPGWNANMGSQIYVRSLPESVPRCASPRFTVSLDTVGAKDQRFFQDAQGDAGLQNALWQTAANLDYAEWFPKETRPLPAGSQSAFQAQKLATTSLVGLDYPAANTTQDTPDKLSAETLQRVGMTLETWLETQP